MARVNILFTGAGRRVELLQSFRAAYRTLGLSGSIVATDVDPLAPALHVADVAELVPRSTDPDYVPKVISLCRKHEVSAVFPLIDPDIPVLAAAAARFQAAGTVVGTMGIEGVQIATDKWKTAQFLKDTGVPCPDTWLPGDLPGDIPGGVRGDLSGGEPGGSAAGSSLAFPLYLKPRFGSASMHTARVDDAQELQVLLKRTPEPLLQEFLEGPEITCDLAYGFDGEFLSMCQRRRIEVRAGEVQKGVTVWDEEIAAHCLTIGRALEARGPITIQCLFHRGVPYFTEINGRFGGGLPLSIAAGLDFPGWYLSLLEGKRPDTPLLGGYQLGLYMTRCDQSFFLSDLGLAGPGSMEHGPWLSQS